jgi:hypothetical protein
MPLRRPKPTDVALCRNDSPCGLNLYRPWGGDSPMRRVVLFVAVTNIVPVVPVVPVRRRAVTGKAG